MAAWLVVGGVRSKDPLPKRSFSGGLLKGGISIKQSMIDNWPPGSSTPPLFGGGRKGPQGWVVVGGYTFGALLGPEATTPTIVCGLFVSGCSCT